MIFKDIKVVGNRQISVYKEDLIEGIKILFKKI